MKAKKDFKINNNIETPMQGDSQESSEESKGVFSERNLDVNGAVNESASFFALKSDKGYAISLKYNPDQEIENINQAFGDLKSIIDSEENFVLAFLVRSFLSRGNARLGEMLAAELVAQKGWDYFLNKTIGEKESSFGIKENHLLISIVVEIISKLGTPQNLPVEKIEKLLPKTADDIGWLRLKALVDFRKEVESAGTIDEGGCINLLTYVEETFWDEKRAREEAIKIIEENPEEYYGILEDLHQAMRETWEEYPGSPLPRFITEKMELYEKMPVEELLKEIYPAYSFNILPRYKNNEEMKGFVLPKDELEEKVRGLIQTKERAYFYANYVTGSLQKSQDLLGKYFNSYNLIPMLGEYARNEGNESTEAQFGYAVNCTAQQIAGDLLLVFNPSNQMIFSLKKNEAKEKNPQFSDTENLMNMAHMISHKNKLMERQYGASAVNLAACLCHWDVLPQGIREKIIEAFDYYHIDYESLIEQGQMADFDSMVNITQDFDSLFTPAFNQEVAEFVSGELGERTKALGQLELLSEEDVRSVIAEEFSLKDYSPLALLAFLYSLDYGSVKKLKEDLDCDISQISVREIFNLFLYLKNKKGGRGYESLITFVNQAENRTAKTQRIKSFLSLESGVEMGEVILNIGEKTKDRPEIADRIFAKFSEIIELTNRLRETLGEVAAGKGKKVSPEELRKAAEYILVKASQFLVSFSQKLKDSKEINEDEILDELEKYHSDLILTAGVWKVIKEEGAQFKDLPSITFEQTTARGLTADQEALQVAKAKYQKVLSREGFPVIPGSSLRGMLRNLSMQQQASYGQLVEMLGMYERNYASNPALQSKLIAGFIKTLETKGDKTRVYMYKDKGKLVSFCRFDDLGKGKKYFGSFNVSPEGSGLAIGNAMMDASLEVEMSGASEIVADCDAATKISSTYIDKRGFVAEKVESNYLGTGIDTFQIVRRENNKKYYYKDYSRNDLLKEYESEFKGKIIYGEEPRFVLSFNTGSREAINAIEDLVNNKGYVITRYFFSNNKKAIVAFEKKID